MTNPKVDSPSKHAKFFAVSGIILVSILAVSSVLYGQFLSQLASDQQTTVTSTTRVTVVVIPGFPVESILIGLLLGLLALYLIRKTKGHCLNVRLMRLHAHRYDRYRSEFGYCARGTF